MSYVEKIRKSISGNVLEKEPLRGHTWYQIGGPCDCYCVPKKAREVEQIVRICADEGIPVFVLGKGSNLLVSDDGLRGVALDLTEACNELDFQGNHVRVGAGWYMPKLVLECEKRGLAGIERFAGIPGSVGGALKMNAGCHGKEIYDVVRDVTFLQNGKVSTVLKNELNVSYRHVASFDPPGTVILSATLDLSSMSPGKLAEERKTYMKKRQATQPINLPSSGSVFKNPSGDHAARLIEAAGLKGIEIGGAAISEKHANFIVNRNHASAADVLALMKKARRAVYMKFGVKLELEVMLVGFKPEETIELS